MSMKLKPVLVINLSLLFSLFSPDLALSSNMRRDEKPQKFSSNSSLGKNSFSTSSNTSSVRTSSNFGSNSLSKSINQSSSSLSINQTQSRIRLSGQPTAISRNNRDVVNSTIGKIQSNPGTSRLFDSKLKEFSSTVKVAQSNSNTLVPSSSVVNINEQKRIPKHRSEFKKITSHTSATEYAKSHGSEKYAPYDIAHVQSYQNHGPSADKLKDNLAAFPRPCNHMMKAADSTYERGDSDLNFMITKKDTFVATKSVQMTGNPLAPELLTMPPVVISESDSKLNRTERRAFNQKTKEQCDPQVKNAIVLMQLRDISQGKGHEWKTRDDIIQETGKISAKKRKISELGSD